MGEIVDALNKARKDLRTEPISRTQPESSALPPPRPANPRLVISREQNGTTNAREVLLNPASPASEAYRKLALKIRAEMRRRNIRSLAVTGPLREEGKTTTACNLALALASISGEQRVALVCLDLRRPNVARSLGVSPQLGIEKALRREIAVLECCHPTDIGGLDLYMSSHPCEDSQALLATSVFSSVLKQLEAQYDFVIIDTPPVLLVPDTVMIAEQAGGWIAVVRHGKTRLKSLTAACGVLPTERRLGIVLNEARLSKNSGHYGYYYLDEHEGENQDRV